MNAQVVRELLLKPSTFQYVSAPIIKIGGDLPPVWGPGTHVDLKLKLFGVLPMSRHSIEIVEADPAGGWARTREHSATMKVWNHELSVEPLGDSACRYTDEIEMDAGAATPVAALFAKGFYAWRHLRWRRLVRQAA